ncbi:enoyl-CoA hydratase-related protein [Exiguobacterium flavidum]|uniref:enoyl-CoA hydratase-related protein n=1 Tax=Exiguobacterium flavidum TaxID=2184695 RepID=UPI000DF84C47|nr:enoyl-CoA hydratase-related protein [Exiguobacterium flavidum]
MWNEIEYRVENEVAYVLMKRPERLNALTSVMLTELTEAMEEASQDDSVRAILLKGDGRGFCAGQDLKTVDPTLVHGEYLESYYHPLIRSMANLKKPIVAALNGVAAGAGLSLALACDFRLMKESATASLAFVHIGLVPDAGSPYYLPRLVGSAKALELALLGETLSAEEAARIGLVTRVYEDEQFDSEVEAFVQRLAKQPTKVIGYIKRLHASSYESTLEEMLAQEVIYQTRAGKTDDHRAALEAFIGKKRPTFSGR